MNFTYSANCLRGLLMFFLPVSIAAWQPVSAQQAPPVLQLFSPKFQPSEVLIYTPAQFHFKARCNSPYKGCKIYLKRNGANGEEILGSFGEEADTTIDLSAYEGTRYSGLYAEAW